jgi:3-hydroxyacyl-CoA dehydrogenase
MSDLYSQSFVSGWYKKFPTNPTFKPSAVLENMVAEGKLGVKSGEGFYKYDKTSNT